MRIQKLGIILVLAIAAVTQYGCANLGKQFEPVASMAADKATVYVYRPSRWAGGGVFYTVNAGSAPIAKLYNGGYFPYTASPGELELWAQTESKSSVTLDLKAGDVKYVKGTIGIGFFIGRPTLSVMDAANGQEEIKECKLIASEGM
jgi:hypothetical protein